MFAIKSVPLVGAFAVVQLGEAPSSPVLKAGLSPLNVAASLVDTGVPVGIEWSSNDVEVRGR
jgi:hypothetical protein